MCVCVWFISAVTYITIDTHIHTHTHSLGLVIPLFRGMNVSIRLVQANRFIYSIYYLSKDYHCCLRVVMYNVYHDLGPRTHTYARSHTHFQRSQFGMELVSDNKQACNNCPKVTLLFFNPEDPYRQIRRPTE